ncbi:MAG: hypothetical protein QM750_02030 [Rubrivivax sp.]
MIRAGVSPRRAALLPAALWLLAALPLAAQTPAAASSATATAPAAHVCARAPSPLPSLLDAAVRQALHGRPGVEFLADGAACTHAREFAASLHAGAARRAVGAARVHAYAALRVDGRYFAVEELVFGDRAAADHAIGRLQASAGGAARGKGVPAWRLVQQDRRVLVLVADRHVLADVQAPFEAIAEASRALAAAPR